jgi:hypothetical protein
MATKSKKPIPVWVNAGETRVVFNRKDGNEWARPLYVNLPNGVREHIAKLLGKTDQNGMLDWSLKAKNNCSFALNWADVEAKTIKSGEHAGKIVDSFTIQIEQLNEWLNQLEFTRRGAVSTDVKDILAGFNPIIFGDDDENKDDDDYDL